MCNHCWARRHHPRIPEPIIRVHRLTGNRDVHRGYLGCRMGRGRCSHMHRPEWTWDNSHVIGHVERHSAVRPWDLETIAFWISWRDDVIEAVACEQCARVPQGIASLLREIQRNNHTLVSFILVCSSGQQFLLDLTVLLLLFQDNLALHAEHFPHTQGSKSAIYQFQIDNNNAKAKQSSSVEFTAEISPGDKLTASFLSNPVLTIHLL